MTFRMPYLTITAIAVHIVIVIAGGQDAHAVDSQAFQWPANGYQIRPRLQSLFGRAKNRAAITGASVRGAVHGAFTGGWKALQEEHKNPGWYTKKYHDESSDAWHKKLLHKILAQSPAAHVAAALHGAHDAAMKGLREARDHETWRREHIRRERERMNNRLSLWRQKMKDDTTLEAYRAKHASAGGRIIKAHDFDEYEGDDDDDYDDFDDDEDEDEDDDEFYSSSSTGPVSPADLELSYNSFRKKYSPYKSAEWLQYLKHRRESDDQISHTMSKHPKRSADRRGRRH